MDLKRTAQAFVATRVAPFRPPRPAAGRRHLDEARRLAGLGDVTAACAMARRALAADAGLDEARHLLAAHELAGYDYYEVLAGLHERIRPRTYLEIGVHSGMSFALAAPATQAIGIDPSPALEQEPPEGHAIHRQTSDAFFAGHRREDVLEHPVELAFIDGMHVFDFVLRDFINVERWSSPDGVIVLHDMYPFDEVSANRRATGPSVTGRTRRTALRAVNRYSAFWTGDVWRLLMVLRMHRPDLTITTLPALPTGLTLVTGLDPSSTVLRDSYDALLSCYRKFPFRVLEADRDAILGLHRADLSDALDALVPLRSPVG